MAKNLCHNWWNHFSRLSNFPVNTIPGCPLTARIPSFDHKSPPTNWYWVSTGNKGLGCALLMRLIAICKASQQIINEGQNLQATKDKQSKSSFQNYWIMTNEKTCIQCSYFIHLHLGSFQFLRLECCLLGSSDGNGIHHETKEGRNVGRRISYI
jgi:hypothetical protein